ncbi:MAG: (2Fe-2S)-binding protein [Phormidesmis sp. RL_2_1]|nr:(2Fe-2S)-binding protein [Phormidesmis sp. RL_2_1]
MTTVKVHFLPDDVIVTAKVGEALLDVAARAGVHISTGCLMGSCHACEVELAGEEEPILACLSTVPSKVPSKVPNTVPAKAPAQPEPATSDLAQPDPAHLDLLEINLLTDPTW